MIGNHDLELALPPVQAALLKGIRADTHQVRFVDDGRAYRVGGALIEHGNRYDGANWNDWSGVRAMASRLSRYEPPTGIVEVSAGSRIVENVVNPLKVRYPFIDLLQPQGTLHLLLLLAFESSLAMDLPMVRRLLWGKYLESQAIPWQTRHVGAASVPEPDLEVLPPSPPARDPELEAVFGDVYRQLYAPDTQVSAAREWWQIFLEARRDSLADILRRQEDIPPERLEQIQVVMRKLLLDDASLCPDGPTGPYGTEAARMLGGDIETVVMGHTHLARHVGPPERATYVNTGTWVDLVRVPQRALVQELPGLAELSNFLSRLLQDDGIREFCPTYADLRISPEGRVARARLCYVRG